MTIDNKKEEATASSTRIKGKTENYLCKAIIVVSLGCGLMAMHSAGYFEPLKMHLGLNISMSCDNPEAQVLVVKILREQLSMPEAAKLRNTRELTGGLSNPFHQCRAEIVKGDGEGYNFLGFIPQVNYRTSVTVDGNHYVEAWLSQAGF